jgi:WbqC-like protein family
MLKIAAHQIALLPWAGFWGKAMAADVTLLMTGVQYTKNDYYSMTCLAGSSKTSLDLTPNQKSPIIDQTPVTWRSVKKLFSTLDQQVFRKNAPRYEQHIDLWEEFKDLVNTEQAIYADNREEINLMELNQAFLQLIARMMPSPPVMKAKPYGFDPGEEIARSKEGTLNLGTLTARKTRKLMHYLQQEANLHIKEGEPFMYLSGKGGLSYLDMDSIPKHIKVVIQEFTTPPPTVSFIKTLIDAQTAKPASPRYPKPREAVDEVHQLMSTQFWKDIHSY